MSEPERAAPAAKPLSPMQKALRKLGLEHKIEREKAYPANWFLKKGRVLVSKTMPKSQLVQKVGELLSKAQRS